MVGKAQSDASVAERREIAANCNSEPGAFYCLEKSATGGERKPSRCAVNCRSS
jgi:hypothetical protein